MKTNEVTLAVRVAIVGALADMVQPYDPIAARTAANTMGDAMALMAYGEETGRGNSTLVLNQLDASRGDICHYLKRNGFSRQAIREGVIMRMKKEGVPLPPLDMLPL
jgi:hypothetical protein